MSYISLIDLNVLERTKLADAPPMNVTLIMVIEERYTARQRIVVLEQSITAPLPLLFKTTAAPNARGGMVSLITLLQLALPANTPAGKMMDPLAAERM